MNDVAFLILVLSAVAILGLALGRIQIRGVGLGIGGVLFGGILVGHFINLLGVEFDTHTLHFIKEFGLILFVYTIGIQVGPGFFASLKSSGLKLNMLAAGIVILGSLTAVALHFIFDLPLEVFLGLYSGAVTNTPSLAAGQQILQELGFSGEQTSTLGLGYAMAYPFGIVGILISMWAVRLMFKVNIDNEAEAYAQQVGSSHKALISANVQIENANLDGLAFTELKAIIGRDVICSRLKSQGELSVPNESTRLHQGDYLHLVANTAEALHRAVLILGKEVDESMSTKGTLLRSVRVVVTNEKVLGRKIGELHLLAKFHVVISRLHRSGVELIANQESSLQFGDILNIVGSQQDVEHVANMLGNTSSKLQHVQMLPIFIGIALGVFIGTLPIHLPQLPAPLKLGLAGGPLIAAIVLSRVGNIGRMHWFMPPSANLALREIGIVLFLSVVGLGSGAHFVETLVEGDGLAWMAYGVTITLLPLLIIGIAARLFYQENYLTICGLLAGSMTDPPALAFANAIHTRTGAAALAYATVYPLVMCLRIVTPQIIAVVLLLML